MTHDCVASANLVELYGSSQTDADRFGSAGTVGSGLQSDGIRDLQPGAMDESFRMRTLAVVSIIKGDGIKSRLGWTMRSPKQKLVLL